MTARVGLSLFSLIAIAIWGANAAAAACCGGGVSTATTIINDDKAQVSISVDQNQTQATVSDLGVWYRPNEPEYQRTLRVSAAHIIADRYQVGFSIPVIQKYHGVSESSGLGDISLSSGYEFLPDWDYNPIRPKGIGFLQLTLPTGRSVLEAQEAHFLDSRGRGFWSLGIGSILTKSYRAWDGLASLEIHRSLDSQVSSSSFRGTLKPGWGGTALLGAGYNLGAHRLGSSLSWVYEDPVELRGSVNGQRSLQQYTNASFVYSYEVQPQWTLMVTYSDQTLLAEPINATLGRSVALQLQRRWER